MTGQELKNILNKEGYKVSTLSQMLGMSQQNLSRSLSNDSVKTDLLEKICDVIDKDMFFFYGGTKYLPYTTSNINTQTVPKNLYDEQGAELRDCYKQIAILEERLKELNQLSSSQVNSNLNKKTGNLK
jgi:DNA-binding Xre family transcriptional regulator